MNVTWSPDEPMTGNVGRAAEGVYAWKESGDAQEMFALEATASSALGAVALRGEVVEHDRGYRAENARPIAIELAIGERDWHILGRPVGKRLLRRLRARYGVGSWEDFERG